MGSKDHKLMIKGKRTKRPRLPSSPLSLTMAAPSDSTSSYISAGGGDVHPISTTDKYSDGMMMIRSTKTTTLISCDSPPPHSASCSIEELMSTSTTTQAAAAAAAVEQDMANCLILLAQGAAQSQPPKLPTSAGRGGTVILQAAAYQYQYQCKTCDRCFPSFQALGGHRASHKRPPKPQENHQKIINIQQSSYASSHFNTTLSLQISNSEYTPTYNKPSSSSSKVHKCSICGNEFNSGQALGGHMRRHRTVLPPQPLPPMLLSNLDLLQDDEKTKRLPIGNGNNHHALDLNLPAPPEDDDHGSHPEEVRVSFSVSSASPPLVDCHL